MQLIRVFGGRPKRKRKVQTMRLVAALESCSGGTMPMINGAHVILSSKNAEADRVFLRDVLKLPNVDVGDGWLIFALPPAEVAIHPAEKGTVHELYLMTADLGALIKALGKRGVSCSPPRNLGWGVLAQVSLPGGGTLGVYEPRHARPAWSEPTKRKVRSERKGSRNAPKPRSGANRRTRG
jgi:hypothetical protein